MGGSKMEEYDVIAHALLFKDWEALEKSKPTKEIVLAVNWICVLHDLKPLLAHDWVWHL